jgi:hypothetical protein
MIILIMRFHLTIKIIKKQTDENNNNNFDAVVG